MLDRNDVPVMPTDESVVTLTFDTADVSGVWKADDKNGDADQIVDFNAGVNDLEIKDKKAKVQFSESSPYVYLLITNEDPGEEINLKVTAIGFTSDSADLEFKVGEAKRLDFDKVFANRSGETEIVEFQVVDDKGPDVAKVVKIQMKTSDRIRLNGKRESITIYTDSKGKASVELQPEWNMVSPGHVDVYADLNNNGLDTDEDADEMGFITINRATNDADKLSIVAKNDDTTFTSRLPVDASDVTFTVTATSRTGRAMPDDYDYSDLDVTYTADGETKDLPGEFEDNVFVVDLSAESGLELVAGKTYTVTFTDNYSIYQPTKSITFTVYDPNSEPVKLSVTEAIYGSTAQPWTDSLKIQDAQNDPAPAAKDVTVTLDVTGDGYVIVGGAVIEDGDEFTIFKGKSEVTVVFFGDTSSGSVKFTFTADDLTKSETTMQKQPPAQ